jgi:hypothetical protein
MDMHRSCEPCPHTATAASFRNGSYLTRRLAVSELLRRARVDVVVGSDSALHCR